MSIPRAAARAFLILAMVIDLGASQAAIPAGTTGAARARFDLGLTLPEYIGALEYMGERSRSDTRPGARYSYRTVGLALDIDIYGCAQGADAALVQREYVLARHAAGTVRGVKLLREGAAQLGTGTLTAREALFGGRGASGVGGSYLWVTASRGRLIEIRLDFAAGFEEDGWVARSEVLEALGDVLARAPDTGPANPRHLDVAILWDPSTPEAERSLWSVYLYTRAAQAASEGDEGALAPGEREASFEEEVRARSMMVHAFRSLSPAQPSAYFVDLDRIEASGFLREYVWRYLRAHSWTEQPQDLRLAAFDEWRATHLRDHVAVTHGRIAMRLAAAKG